MADDQQSDSDPSASTGTKPAQPADSPEVAALKARNAILAQEVAIAGNQQKLATARQALVPDSPELGGLKAQSALLAQEAAIAESQQKVVAAMFPSSVKPLEGSAKIDGDHPIEGQILAYHAINQLAETIAAEVQRLAVKRVFIHNDSEISLLLGLQSFTVQLETMRTEFTQEVEAGETAVADAEAALKQDVAQPVAAAAFLAAPLLIGAVARTAIDLLALFRTDVTLKYKDFTITDLALIASVAGALRRRALVVYHTALVPPALFDRTSTILVALNDLHQLKSRLEGVLKGVQRLQDRLKKEIEDLETRIAAAAAAQPAQNTKPLASLKSRRAALLDHLATVEARLAAVGASFVAFTAALVKADATATSNPLAQLLRAEKLAAAAGADSHLLLVKVAAAGGGVKTKQSLFRSARAFHSGGSIVEFILFAPDGQIASAGTLPYYTGFIELKERPEQAADLSEFRRP
jgi:hypothetical protein